MAAVESDEERDRRTGLSRILDAVADIGVRIDQTAEQVNRLSRRMETVEARLAEASPTDPPTLDVDALAADIVERVGPARTVGVDPVDVETLARHVCDALADDLALATGGSVGSQDVLVDLIRRTVASSHRVLLGQVAELLASAQSDQRHALDLVGRDVEAIRRAIERAGGATR